MLRLRTRAEVSCSIIQSRDGNGAVISLDISCNAMDFTFCICELCALPGDLCVEKWQPFTIIFQHEEISRQAGLIVTATEIVKNLHFIESFFKRKRIGPVALTIKHGFGGQGVTTLPSW